MAIPAHPIGTPGLKADIVIPVHNRRDITLRCLANLYRLGAPAWAGLIVADDGSTDGTSDAIREQYPAVVLLHGDGNLWWTGAIVRGMAEALERGSELIFWLNDDCLPAPAHWNGWPCMPPNAMPWRWARRSRRPASDTAPICGPIPACGPLGAKEGESARVRHVRG